MIHIRWQVCHTCFAPHPPPPPPAHTHLKRDWRLEIGAMSFLDPFSEGTYSAEKQTGSRKKGKGNEQVLKCCLPCKKNGWTSTGYIKLPYYGCFFASWYQKKEKKKLSKKERINPKEERKKEKERKKKERKKENQQPRRESSIFGPCHEIECISERKKENHLAEKNLYLGIAIKWN